MQFNYKQDRYTLIEDYIKRENNCDLIIIKNNNYRPKK